MKRHKALSIREIVVLSIIFVVFAAVIAPAITDSLLQMQWRTCAGNMGVLARAFLLYAADNNGRFPAGGSLDAPSQQGGRPNGAWVWFDGMWYSGGGSGYHYNNPSEPWSWRMNPSKGSIWPYTDRNNQTYICPADIHAQDPHCTVYGAFGLSYSLNSNIIWAAYGDMSSNNSPALVSDLNDPNATVLLAENTNSPKAVSPFFKGITRTAPQFDGIFRWWQSAPGTAHWGGSNFAFCDGHVGWVAVADQKNLAFYRNGRPADPRYFTFTFSEE